MKYLVIVESPSKTVKIKDYLTKLGYGTFTVVASMGHIYELEGLKSIKIEDNFSPTYVPDKNKLKNLLEIKKISNMVDEVIIATDPDREGEGIGFHLVDYLKLDPMKTKRLRFFEITQNGVKEAWEKMENGLDLNLYNAQQTRRILDLLVGFSISPLLWGMGKGLSAGRCQSPTVHIIREREDNVLNQTNSTYFNLKGIFICQGFELGGEIPYRFDKDNLDEIRGHLEEDIGKEFEILKGENRESKRNPPPPFTTSTIQQELSIKLGINPKQAMGILQKLYESGKITYMRTDSPSISDTGVGMIQNYINEVYSPEVFQYRKYDATGKNAQEAHECIRPTDITVLDVVGDIENRVYGIIHKRTVASLMVSHREEKLEILYKLEGIKIANREDVKNKVIREMGCMMYRGEFTRTIELGWMRVYTEEMLDEITQIEDLIGEKCKFVSGECKEIIDKQVGRYTQASIIAELEKLGIGRPSTYSSLVTTILERKYVEADSRKGEEIDIITLSKEVGKEIEESVKRVSTQNERNKLFLTALGRVVDDFMVENFKEIMDAKFTADMEEDLDKIARGEEVWYEVIKKVYNIFMPKVNKVKEGPKEKLKIDKEEREVGKYEEKPIIVKRGPFGYYVEYEKLKIKAMKEITEEEAIILIKEKREKTVREWANAKVMNGPYGMYVVKGRKTAKLPEGVDVKKMTLVDIDKIIVEAEENKKKFIKRKYFKKK